MIVGAIDDLVTELARLPGIGRKTAQRLTYHLLRAPDADARTLAAAALRAPDRLDLRGYIGISLIGRTTTWTR